MPATTHIITNETNDIKCSIYLTEEGDYLLWLKVGVALVEIKQDQFVDVIEILLETLNDIEEMEHPNV